MAVALRSFVVGASALCMLAACTPSEPPAAPTAGDTPAADAPPTTAALAAGLVAALGGRAALESIDTLVLRGGGTRTRMGQIAETGGEDPTGQIQNVTETIDFANDRAALDYDVVSGGFMQHRTEVLTTFDGAKVGWETGPGRPNIVVSPNGLFSWATQNSPEVLLRRNVVTIALAAAETAPEDAAVERTFNGAATLYGTAMLPSGEAVGLYFDPDTGLLDGFATLDTETMLGDVDAEYALGDYGAVAGVDGLTLPHSMTITKDGAPYSSIEYAAITANEPGAIDIFAIPDDALEQAAQAAAADGAWAPLQWNEVAPGVFHAVGYSHHSLVVEFPTFVVVIEGPYTEAQGLTLARRIDEEIGKPIRYVVPTHPHYDHTGGIRALAAVGATVLVAAGHEAELRGIVEAPHTNPPDELARRADAGAEVGGVEVFEDRTTIEEGDRRVELYAVDTIPHVKPKTLAFVPGPGVLFQSDLFFGGASPDAAALYETIETLGLDVQTIVGGHGGVLPFAALRDAVAAGGQ
jgi:glyoxylase-like metal-dependent hydrolase (beta-lactamase superfamily II)